MNLIGAGGYGIVIRNSQTTALKLLYDTFARHSLQKETSIHKKAHMLLPTIIPAITFYSEEELLFQNKPYLCGIGMTYLPPPLDFEEAVHIVLGYHGDDIDTSWGRTVSQPVGSTNPTRGFFASPATMEWIWTQEGSTMTIDKMAAIMGSTYRSLLDAGILPIDLEWIWSQGRPWLIDFGLCEEGHADPLTFLNARGLRGLADDIYIPHAGDAGYEAFITAYTTTD